MSKRFPDLITVLDEAYTTLSPDRTCVMSFDREGRMVGFFRDGLTYRRALDSRVLLRWREDRRHRRWLSGPEAFNVYRDVYALAREVYPETAGELRRRLEEEILTWTPRMLLNEERRFRSVYHPIPILPPDQYRSVVLQVTEGCTWNRCTFCNFYKGRRFRMRTLSQFRKHIQAVKRLFGKGLRMRKGLFLGDGNALALNADRLLEYINATRESFPDEPVYGFVDVFSGERHTVDEWKALRESGLHRVYIGMETGSDELLRFLNKPGSGDDVLGLVSDLKQAGVAVSPIVMVGIGGDAFREQHARATLRVLERMELGADDILYISPFIEFEETEYARQRREAGIRALDEAEMEREYDRLCSAARSLGIKTSRYDIRDFIY
jgi:radical SAM superfamily enzyme YgiQ (UPF0313 family)